MSEEGHEYDADAYEQVGLTVLRVSLAHARGVDRAPKNV